MAMQTQTRQVEYKGRKAMDHGVARMTLGGWRVTAVTELEQRSGCMRFILLGLFAAVFKPAPHYLVTYSR